MHSELHIVYVYLDLQVKVYAEGVTIHQNQIFTRN